MNTWHKLFEQKLQEVLNKDNKHYLFATMSPTSQGNCARELIAEEYYAQLQEIEKLAAKVAITERDYSFMKDLALAYEKALETKATKPLSDEEIKDLAIEYGFGYSVIRFARAIEEKVIQNIAMDNLVAWQQEFDKPVAWMIIDVDNGKSLQFKENKFSEINIPLYTAPKELSDEELNKAFDYYCETDEGVLRFDFDLRTEWKQEQLQRWKEAFRKARD